MDENKLPKAIISYTRKLRGIILEGRPLKDISLRSWNSM
jgi:hypothetical protein